VGMRDVRTLRMLNTTHPLFSQGYKGELSVCENRCRDLFRMSLLDTKYIPSSSWMTNLVECKSDMGCELCWVAYKMKTGQGMLWNQGRIAFKAAYLLEDYHWLRKNLPQAIDIYLGPSFGGERMFELWDRSQRGPVTRKNYEESLFLMIDNCLQSMQSKVRPHVSAALLSRILDFRFKRNGENGIYMSCKEGRRLYDRVLRHFKEVRPEYCLLSRYEKRIQIRES